jgi:hypothetical protein
MSGRLGRQRVLVRLVAAGVLGPPAPRAASSVDRPVREAAVPVGRLCRRDTGFPVRCGSTMIADVGYDLHITRAFVSYDSERYPILGTEVDDLARDEPDLTIPPDAPRRPNFCYINWESDASDGYDYLRFDAGRLTTKNPRPELVRRMTELAARLDAWTLGDNGEVYEWDGDRVVDRQRGPEAFAWHARYITRGTWSSGMNGHAPIRPDEWAELVADQPDFATMTRIETTLPSGVRWISCPPVACWMGHPSARPMPFFFDVDVIQVRHADGPTVRRMTALAASLAAKVLDDENQPA